MLQRRVLLARVILACVAAIQQAMVSSALVCSASMDVIIRIEIYSPRWYATVLCTPLAHMGTKNRCVCVFIVWSVPHGFLVMPSLTVTTQHVKGETRWKKMEQTLPHRGYLWFISQNKLLSPKQKKYCYSPVINFLSTPVRAQLAQKSVR